MHSSASLAAKGSSFVKSECEERNRPSVSRARNEPRACAVSSGIVIIGHALQFNCGLHNDRQNLCSYRLASGSLTYGSKRSITIVVCRLGTPAANPRKCPIGDAFGAVRKVFCSRPKSAAGLAGDLLARSRY